MEGFGRVYMSLWRAHGRQSGGATHKEEINGSGGG